MMDKMRNPLKNGHPNQYVWAWVKPLIVWHEFGFWSYLALSWTWSWRIASRRITDRICVRSLSVSCCSSRSGNKWPPPDWNGKRKSRLKIPPIQTFSYMFVLWMNLQISSCITSIWYLSLTEATFMYWKIISQKFKICQLLQFLLR